MIAWLSTRWQRTGLHSQRSEATERTLMGLRLLHLTIPMASNRGENGWHSAVKKAELFLRKKGIRCAVLSDDFFGSQWLTETRILMPENLCRLFWAELGSMLLSEKAEGGFYCQKEASDEDRILLFRMAENRKKILLAGNGARKWGGVLTRRYGVSPFYRWEEGRFPMTGTALLASEPEKPTAFPSGWTVLEKEPGRLVTGGRRIQEIRVRIPGEDANVSENVRNALLPYALQAGTLQRQRIEIGYK